MRELYLVLSDMKKNVLFLMVFALLPVRPVYAMSLEGYTSPAPYRVVSVNSDDTIAAGEFAAGFSIEQSSSPDYYRYEARLATGIRDNLEFGLNIPYHHGDSSSLENATFGVKHRVLEEGRSFLSGAYLLSMSTPLRSDVNSTQVATGAGVILSKHLGPILGHLNVSYIEQLDPAIDDEWHTGAGFEFSAARGLRVLAEIYATKPRDSDADFVFSEARFAYRFESEGDLYSMVGVGVGLEDQSTNYRIFASVSMHFESSRTR